MIMGRLFGTDGVRGVANSELTPELAFNLGKAGAYVLNKDASRPKVVIGRDTRISGDMLEQAISTGILAVGGDVISVGVMPTPGVARLVKHYEADAGIVISASHNPFEYNGIKFFNGNGFKLDDEIEDQIEDIIVQARDVNSHITGDKLGRYRSAGAEAEEVYIDFLLGTVDMRLDGIKIVLDCANGAASDIAGRVYEKLGAEVIVMGNKPDGVNINDGCGSTHPEKLADAVVREGAFMGMAYDGDADRLIAIDEKGRIIDGDKLICIAARMLRDENKLEGDLVTATVMSNLGLHKHLEKMGLKVESTNVGDRYVLESMLKTGGVLGGEQSGHIIFLNHTTTGDGILSSLQILRAVLRSGKKSSELSDEIMIYPQVLKNAKVKNENKHKFENDPQIQEEIDRVVDMMEGSGRVLIRPSGTEPLVRVMLEGEDIEQITKLAEDMAKMLTRKFG
jgi:phosphoglucosamine mutase